jgi:hypothetical protein
MTCNLALVALLGCKFTKKGLVFLGIFRYNGRTLRSLKLHRQPYPLLISHTSLSQAADPACSTSDKRRQKSKATAITETEPPLIAYFVMWLRQPLATVWPQMNLDGRC